MRVIRHSDVDTRQNGHGATLDNLVQEGKVQRVRIYNKHTGVIVAIANGVLTAVPWMRAQGDEFYMNHDIDLRPIA